MELKDCSQVHFIQAIRKGFVTKTLNIDSRGKPALRFKKIKAIYESEDSRNLGSCSTLQPQEGGYNVFPFGCGRYHVERSCLPMGGSRIIKSDPGTYKFSYDCGDNKRNIDWNNISFSETTLKQLQERCKAKKRKLSESVDLTNQDTKTCSYLKHDHDNLEPNEDDFDLEEPLSRLKLKISKKMKAKQKCIRKFACSSSQTDVSVVETEQIQSVPQDSLQTNGDLPGPINIEVEITELGSSNCENVVCVSDDSTSDCHDNMDFHGDVYGEVPKRINGSELGMGESISIAKESPSCVVNEISYEYLEHVDPISLLPVNATVWGTMKDDFPEITSHESFLTPVSKFKKEDNIACLLPCDSPPEAISLTTAMGSEMSGSCGRYSFSQEEISCQTDGESSIQVPDMAIHGILQCKELNNGGDGYMFEDDSKEDPPALEANAIINSLSSCISSQNSHPWLDHNSRFDFMDDGSTTTEENHCLLTTERPISKFKKEDDIACLLPCDSSPEAISLTTAMGSEMYGSCERYSFSQEEISCQSYSNSGIQVPDMAIHGGILQCKELNNGGDEYIFEDDNKEDPPALEANAIINSLSSYISSHNSHPWLDHNVRFDSMDEGSTTAEENHSLLTTERPISKFKKEDNIACLLPCDGPPEAISLTMAMGSEMYGSCERYSFSQEEISCQTYSNSGIQVPDMAIHCILQCKELNNGGDGYMFEDDNKEDPPSLEANAIINSLRNYISSQDSHPWLDHNGGFDSMDDGSTTTKENCSSLTTERPVSACVVGARDCSAGSHSSDATDGFTVTKVLESHNLEHPSQRFFSTRKAISPASGEKLCQAVDANELHENIGHYRSGLEGAETTINSEKIIKKSNNVKIGSLQLVPKGILKGAHVSRAIPPAGTECTSTQSCSLKAIAFSQRQMHDIQSLAMKLTKELKSMKDIAEETLRFEAFQSTSSKYNADKIRTAISNAAEVEETTRKWLSMMARDCNRFFKIMSQTSTKKKAAAAASGNGVHKDRRKITFADEAGGMLCHVKVLEDSPGSILGSNGSILGSKCEKPELQTN